jgi:hypothetical protein
VPRRTNGALAFWAGAGDAVYLRHFRDKWGDALARLFLFGEDSSQYIATLGVEKMIRAGDYVSVIVLRLAHRE